MKKRRNRAIEKAKLPHEKVQLNDNLKFTTADKMVVSPVTKVTLKDLFGETVYEGYSLNVDISREDKDLTVTSPYTTPTLPKNENAVEVNHVAEIPEELLSELPEEKAKSSLVKVKDFFKGIFKR